MVARQRSVDQEGRCLPGAVAALRTLVDDAVTDDRLLRAPQECSEVVVARPRGDERVIPAGRRIRGDAALPGPAGGGDLALDAALAEPAGDQHPVALVEVRGVDVLGVVLHTALDTAEREDPDDYLDPANVDLNRDDRISQGFLNAVEQNPDAVAPYENARQQLTEAHAESARVTEEVNGVFEGQTSAEVGSAGASGSSGASQETAQVGSTSRSGGAPSEPVARTTPEMPSVTRASAAESGSLTRAARSWSPGADTTSRVLSPNGDAAWSPENGA
jgi:hypothetical protein